MRSGRDSLPGRFSNDATVTESAGRGAAAAPCEGIAMTPCNPCICAGNPNTGIPIDAIMAARACMSASVAAFMPGGAVPACTCCAMDRSRLACADITACVVSIAAGGGRAAGGREVVAAAVVAAGSGVPVAVAGV